MGDTVAARSPVVIVEVVRRAIARLSTVEDSTLSPEWRRWRWVVALPGDLMAYLADDDDGWRSLAREGVLLRSLAPRVNFGVPAVVLEDPVERLQIRRRTPGGGGFWIEELVFGVPGHVPYAQRLREDFRLTSGGRRLAAEIGRALAQLQAALPAAEVAAIGFPEEPFAPILDVVEERLADLPGVADLRTTVVGLRTWVDTLRRDPVLAHGDLYAPNISVVAGTGAFGGVFDFEQSCVAHRLYDFQYLPGFGRPFMEVLLQSYADESGVSVTMADVAPVHVLAALEHVARVAPGTSRWARCLEWARSAVAAAPDVPSLQGV
jgi:hypothetical protein